MSNADEHIDVNTDDATVLTARPRVAKMFRLQWEEVQQTWVLLYPEGMVKLNPSAGEIMKRCNGERSTAEIVAELEQAFGSTGLRDDVLAFLNMARQQHWIDIRGPT
jgi:pyrroloquinoline quinone biosynthesis protein D